MTPVALGGVEARHHQLEVGAAERGVAGLVAPDPRVDLAHQPARPRRDPPTQRRHHVVCHDHVERGDQHPRGPGPGARGGEHRGQAGIDRRDVAEALEVGAVDLRVAILVGDLGGHEGARRRPGRYMGQPGRSWRDACQPIGRSWRGGCLA
ncbi:MAG: hypothetical protein IPL61_35550 [Myxococcales bacterium]|nr:hypothetical protein [Myxococcales bacterium]